MPRKPKTNSSVAPRISTRDKSHFSLVFHGFFPVLHSQCIRRLFCPRKNLVRIFLGISLGKTRKSPRITLLTSSYGREVCTDLVEALRGAQTAGQSGHLQALVFGGETHSGYAR